MITQSTKMLHYRYPVRKIAFSVRIAVLYKHVMLRRCCLVFLKCLRAVLDSIGCDTWLVASLDRIYYN